MIGIVRRLCVAAAVLAAGLADGGPAAAQSDMAAFPLPGRLIAVDGHDIHLFCIGAGVPTVILEEGAGGGVLNWTWVQRDVARVTRACSLDRPGYGWSERTDDALDGEHASRRLAALLAAANEPGPFVLVGHSLGGAFARIFAAEHRDATAGLVLVDGTPPDLLTAATEAGLPPVERHETLAFIAASDLLWGTLTGLGIVRGKVDTDARDLPADTQAAMQAFLQSPARARTSVREQSAVYDTLVQMRSLGALGALPLTVISADRWVDPDPTVAEQRAAWDKRLQHGWLALSTDSRFIIVPGADHLSLLSNQSHAAVVASAVVDMIKHVRQPRRSSR
jgi:pimeloyl-ACP methyl ester carboxylesterase